MRTFCLHFYIGFDKEIKGCFRFEDSRFDIMTLIYSKTPQNLKRKTIYNI